MNEETIIKLIQDRGLEEAGSVFYPAKNKKTFFRKTRYYFLFSCLIRCRR